MSRKLVIGGALILALGAASGGIAIAGGVGDDDKPLTGTALQKATAAAVAHAGGGTVVETEIGDDGAAYGVEVRLSDGRTVEVNLDENFNVVGQEPDDDGANEQDEGGED